jgi:hypothetical protein
MVARVAQHDAEDDATRPVAEMQSASDKHCDRRNADGVIDVQRITQRDRTAKGRRPLMRASHHLNT